MRYDEFAYTEGKSLSVSFDWLVNSLKVFLAREYVPLMTARRYLMSLISLSLGILIGPTLCRISCRRRVMICGCIASK